jgi:titin
VYNTSLRDECRFLRCPVGPLPATVVANASYLGQASASAKVTVTSLTVSYDLRPESTSAWAGQGDPGAPGVYWWTAWSPTSLQGYHLYRDGVLAATIAPDAAQPFIDRGVHVGETHAYAVAGFNAAGEAPLSAPSTVVVNGSPERVESLAAEPYPCGVWSGVVAGTALAWVPPNPVDSVHPYDRYVIYRGTSPTALTPYQSLAAISVAVSSVPGAAGATAVSWTDCQVAPATRYYYAIVTRSSLTGWESAPSATVSSDAPPNLALGARPTAPSASATATGPTTIRVAWSPASSTAPISEYRVYRWSAGSAMWEQAATVTPAAGNEWSDTSLQPGSTARFRVTAVNAFGEGAPSAEVSATTPTTVPGAVPSASASVRRSGGIDVTWAMPATDGGSAITSYVIYRRSGSGALAVYKTVSGSSTSFRDTSVSRGVTYTYRIAARNVRGEGPQSPEASATP